MASLGKLIQSRLKDIDAKPADLRRELERVGAPVARQSIHAWLTGHARPSSANMIALLDVLLIPPEQLPQWWLAHAAWTPPRKPSPLDEDGVPTVVDPTPAP